jgi:hypothetical protein
MSKVLVQIVGQVKTLPREVWVQIVGQERQLLQSWQLETIAITIQNLHASNCTKGGTKGLSEKNIIQQRQVH